MLLQTNSYVVPKDRRAEHARLLRRFRQTLARLGCDHFETYEQVGQNWSTGESSGRFVQIMRFRDRRHQLAVQAAEHNDPLAQQLIAEFCELINFPYQQQHGLFAVGFYTSALPVAPARPGAVAPVTEEPGEEVEAAAAAAEATAAEETPPADQQTYVAQASAPADFSGEPVTPEDAHAAGSLADETETSPEEAPSPDEAPIAETAPEEPADQPGSSRHAAEFRQEMEALGAQLEEHPIDEHQAQEPIPTAREERPEEALPEEGPLDQPADALPDVSLDDEHPAIEEEHAAGGNGSLLDPAPAESDRFGNGEALHKDEPHEATSHGAFDTFLEENFGSESPAGEDQPLPGGSGIGQVLDAGLLDDDDLDVALPADLIEDGDLERHARDAEHPNGLGDGREPHRA